ncbi:MAG: glycosyltransferase family 39 protein, partial [Anaerolineae bacterium]
GEVLPAGEGGRKDALFFALIALVALLLSYGRNAFLYPLFYRWAPGWALFRDQERAAFIVAFGLSVLAGYGAARLDALSLRAGRRFALGFAAGAAGGLMAVAAMARAAGHSTDDATLAGKVAAGLLILVAWMLSRHLVRSPAGQRRALIALVAADLFIANAAVNLAPPQPLPPATALAVAAAVAGPAAADGRVGGRVHNDGVLPEDYGMIVGVEEIGGSSPLRLARFAALLGSFPRDRLWQLTGVKYVLSAEPKLYAASRLLAAIPGPNGPAYLHELDATNPRAWVATAIATADDAAALPLLGDAGFDPRTTALLPPPINGTGRPPGLEDGIIAAGESQVRLERIGPGHLRAHVQSGSGGLLIVSENWLPGWRATIRRPDEATAAAVPVVRADLTLLAAPVPPGESTVELIYRPASVQIGLLIGAATLLALGLTLIWRRARFGLRRPGGAFTSGEMRGRAAAFAIVLLAFAARAFRLGHQELRGDEALGRLFSLEPFDQIVRSTIALREPHPVAGYFVQKVWFALAGHSEFALRFVSLWFGVLAVALLYGLGRRLALGRWTAGVAAGLLALSPYAIWHSQDARMYSMSLALALASTLLMLEALARRRAIWWAGYVAASLLALHTHYYAAYVIVAQNLFIFGRALTTRPARRDLRPWLAAQAATGLLYLPWLIAARATLTGYVGNGDSPG